MTATEPAWKTHPDGKEPGVDCTLSGLAELTDKHPGLGELKETCKRQAEQGIDPFQSGTVQVGLFLPVDDYEALKEYAKTLTVKRSFVRRRRAA